MSKPAQQIKAHTSEHPVQYDLEGNWVFSVAVLADQVARRVSNIVSEVSDLNLSHWRVLAAVADKAGRTASEVVELTPMDKGVVSRAVKHLSDTGLVERRACASDGRLSYLFMTDEGYLTYERIVTALRERGATGESLPNGQALNDALKTMIASYSEA
ncbi:MAG: MarR family transcriptional regulator [Pseudomonadota bacterium]